jgi:hypothetical protein
MKIKFPKRITILACEFKVIQDKRAGGGSFNTKEGTMTIGTLYLEDDPSSVFNAICHEVMEIITSLLCLRYSDQSVMGNYKFIMDHKEFQTAIIVFSDIIKNFIV